jgi:hypothetical protein
VTLAAENDRLLSATVAWLTPLLRRKRRVLLWLREQLVGLGIDPDETTLIATLEAADARLQGDDLDRRGHVRREPRPRRDISAGLPSLGKRR